jgi:hypothetical protein
MRFNPILRLVALSTLLTFGVAIPSSVASASSGAQQVSVFFFNPVITGPAPVPLPSNCPFPNDANFSLNFVSGNAVLYGTANKNGDWFGANAEGIANFTEGNTLLYTGQLHAWFGAGNNAKAQSESGFTLSFNGTGVGGTLTIHANTQLTTNASGVTTATVTNINVTCS